MSSHFPTTELCSVCDEKSDVYCYDCSEYMCTYNNCDTDIHNNNKMSQHRRGYDNNTLATNSTIDDENKSVASSSVGASIADVSSAAYSVHTESDQPTTTFQPQSDNQHIHIHNDINDTILPVLTKLNLSAASNTDTSVNNSARSTQSKRSILHDIVNSDLMNARTSGKHATSNQSLQSSTNNSSRYSNSTLSGVSSIHSTHSSTSHHQSSDDNSIQRISSSRPHTARSQRASKIDNYNKNQWLLSAYTPSSNRSSNDKSKHITQSMMCTMSTRPITSHTHNNNTKHHNTQQRSFRAQSARLPLKQQLAQPLIHDAYEPIPSHSNIIHKSTQSQLNQQLRNNIAYMTNLSSTIDKYTVQLNKLIQSTQSDSNKLIQSQQRIECALLIVNQRNEHRVQHSSHPIVQQTINKLTYDQQLEQSLFTEYQSYHSLLESIDNCVAQCDIHCNDINDIIHQLQQQQCHVQYLCSIDQQCLDMTNKNINQQFNQLSAINLPADTQYEPQLIDTLLHSVDQLKHINQSHIKQCNELYHSIKITLRDQRRKSGYCTRQCIQYATEQVQSIQSNYVNGAGTHHLHKHIQQLHVDRQQQLSELEICDARYRLRSDSIVHSGIVDTMLQQLSGEIQHINSNITIIDNEINQLQLQIDNSNMDAQQYQQLLHDANIIVDFYTELISYDPIEHTDIKQTKKSKPVNPIDTDEQLRKQKQLLRNECALLDRAAVKLKQRNENKRWTVTSEFSKHHNITQANIDQYMYLNSRPLSNT